MTKKDKKLVRHVINPVKVHPRKITEEDKEPVNDLDYDGIEFPVQEKYFSKIGKRTIFTLMSLVTKMG